MLRQKQEIIEMRVPGIHCDGAIPGRSARRRYADLLGFKYHLDMNDRQS